MSFILDALKKSENDRQRQSGPALFEVRVAPPRSRVPSWAMAVAALLAINLGVVAWLMMRRPASAAVPPAQAHASPLPAPALQAQIALVPASPPPANVAAAVETAPVVASDSAESGGQAAGDASGAPVPAARRSPASELNPDDYAPAKEPAGEFLPGAGRVRVGTTSGFPTYEQAAAQTSIPPLRMDLHVYAQEPDKRFVLVNMKRLHEGESLPDGIKVDTITPDGAILTYRGSTFVLERH